MPSNVGRPRRASAELLQEAAFELFQLRGYRQTSVELIAKTAGFSRATFFNFFSSKAELFWVETDKLIHSLGNHLALCAGRDPVPTLRAALLEFAEGLTSAAVPWALQNYRLLEAADDLVASGAGRAIGLNRLFLGYLRRREQETGSSAQAEAATVLALLLIALMAWVDAGVERGSLAAHLEPLFARE